MKPVYLCIMDGVGIGAKNETNAVYQAIKDGKAPFFKDLFDKPYALLECSGKAVGLPVNTMGNSEVNHLNMGAGRVVYQSIERINVAIEDKSFFKNEALMQAVSNCKKNNSTLHLMGVIQGHGGTVHGSISHVFALLELVKQQKLEKVFIHIFGDGRDTNPNALGEIYIKMLQDKILELELRKIAMVKTIMGREIAMDRDTAWDKTLIALKAIALGECENKAQSSEDAIKQSYDREITDEFIRPVKIGEYEGIEPADSIIFWNYRQDRAIQTTVAFIEKDKKFFNYKKGTNPIDENIYKEIEEIQAKLKNTVFVAMTEYYEGINALTAYPEKEIPDTVGEVVSKAGLLQLRIAGTEKFAHVTGWFSGRRSEPFLGEDRILVQDPTLKARTEQGKRYDLVPEMTAYHETEEVLSAMDKKDYALIVHNFQNGDMVGHTGNLLAAEKAMSVVSECLSKIVPKWLAKGGVVVLTADHGNADEMALEKNHHKVVSTQHSLNPVPLWILGIDKTPENGIIPDIGVTILKLMELAPSKEMTAKALF
ncbi:phosphoglycerate mutase (2,3-diphosphoglycerate-independent) [candidate division WOR-1 bacterium RIFOXYC2_FULL_37_10]|uniref:2,3-bisphosphoglycerate-independent phosphoglycerate mutase n=1 Tax=candidate division WOR-1 bacterium RIFOXYB2_FULL_37_13 TaxID=1802579 RepID=A0A1F4SDR7_UNCSA|nr:MAG: phosphoglycerate mutase (2,3-diphosphoglycerate-independent) [candidate division WOR-1 bacterium RIFOXYA2_FULL_37_7]OGC18564.1 MAG: phosphoglycerate mutase (2,3-diphosphoglycerate-independent) [candidate division WOR-1 bacterium RIFOXYB2_FULL_37_13]OGC36882.1 MAG: phosphoglycerate mutase (2,3-diphosphoglycerate-independent) [candidate division WOR-1 bacterium RIFOXYC2_FULL_37_10]